MYQQPKYQYSHSYSSIRKDFTVSTFVRTLIPRIYKKWNEKSKESFGKKSRIMQLERLLIAVESQKN